MPRIPQGALASVVYIYPSVQDAGAEKPTGGTGFVMAVSNQGPSKGWLGIAHALDWQREGIFYWLYVVTAKHNVVDRPSVAVRFAGDSIAPVEVSRDDWQTHPDGDDVAVWLIGPAADYEDFGAIVEDYLMTEDRSREIDPGDEAFFVGRFIGSEGRGRNAPTVRFGNVAAGELVPIRHKTFQIDQMSWLVEMRSLPGYSGSPVFVYSGEVEMIPTTAAISEDDIMYVPLSRLFLLGVDWCHLNDERPVLDKDGESVEEGWLVRQNSGMMGVVPASKIADILYDEEMVALREEAEKKDSRKRGASAEPDSAGDRAPTRDDFLGDLRKAARRKGESSSRSGKGKR